MIPVRAVIVARLVLAIALLTTDLAYAEQIASGDAKASERVWKGTIKLWSANLCDGESGCSPLPQPLGVQWSVEIPVKDEPAPGYHVVSRTVFQQAPWTVTVLVTRTNPVNGVPSFLAVQTTLKEETHGVVAQCARYDALEAFSFLPPGSCSGQMGGKLVGVSLLSPFVTAAP